MPEPQSVGRVTDRLPRFFFVYQQISLCVYFHEWEEHGGTYLYMIEGLPDMSGHEKDTLYIVGNGFDLAHGILSKYKHFCCWLNLNGYEDYADSLQKMFPNLDKRIDCLWSNFESALESYDLHELYNQYIPFPQNNSQEEWDNNIVIGTKNVKTIIDNIPILLKKWAEEIRVNVSPFLMHLSPESKYLSFNYTLTLEKIYHIPESHICHIHEKVKGDSKLIVGNDLQISTNNLPANSDEEEKSQVLFVKALNGLAKPKQHQIDKYHSFFASLSNINNIVVIGHSLAPVDLRYFGEVKQSVKKNTKWYFSMYTHDDIDRVMHFVKPALLQQNYIDNFELFNLKN